MGLWSLLYLGFDKESIKDVFHFYLLPGIHINKVMAVSKSNVIIPVLKLCMGKADSVMLMAIVLVQQGNTPVTVMVFC